VMLAPASPVTVTTPVVVASALVAPPETPVPRARTGVPGAVVSSM
jgi:hypothetical protein